MTTAQHIIIAEGETSYILDEPSYSPLNSTSQDGSFSMVAGPANAPSRVEICGDLSKLDALYLRNTVVNPL
jgi:hypothetical protein